MIPGYLPDGHFFLIVDVETFVDAIRQNVTRLSGVVSKLSHQSLV